MNLFAFFLITNTVLANNVVPFWSEMRALLKAQENERTANRIAGGKAALEGEAPWMVAISEKWLQIYGQFCGGAIIGERTLLTAAHCVQK